MADNARMDTLHTRRHLSPQGHNGQITWWVEQHEFWKQEYWIVIWAPHPCFEIWIPMTIIAIDTALHIRRKNV